MIIDPDARSARAQEKWRRDHTSEDGAFFPDDEEHPCACSDGKCGACPPCIDAKNEEAACA